MPRKVKNPQKKVPEKGVRLVIDDCNEWADFLIAGKYYPRLTSKGTCEECHTKSKLHSLGCSKEICPACLTSSWFCDCPAEMPVDIVCET